LATEKKEEKEALAEAIIEKKEPLEAPCDPVT